MWSTFLTACCTGVTTMWDLALDSAGNVFVTGSSNQANFPTTLDAFQASFVGPAPSGDVHLTKLDAFGETLVYSTYFGGSGSDTLALIGLDAAEQPHLSFRTSSSNLPVTPGAHDSSYAGSTDIGVAKFALPLLPWRVLGGGLAGSLHTPNLAGGGPLTPGAPTRWSVRGALPNGLSTLVVGLAAINLPFKGGTLVPEPLLLVSFAMNAQGNVDIVFPWIAVPGGFDFHTQVWIRDPGAIYGWSATNALRMISQ